MTLSSSQISSSDLVENSIYLTSDGKLLYNTNSNILGIKFKLNNATLNGNISVITNTISLFDGSDSGPFVSSNNDDNGYTYLLPSSSDIINLDDNGLLFKIEGIQIVKFLSSSAILPGHGILGEMTFNEGIVSNVFLSDIIVATASSHGQISSLLPFTLHEPSNQNNKTSIILPSQNEKSGFLSKTSVSLNGILYSKNASPFKTKTVPQGSDFSLNRYQFRKNVSAASKGNDSSTRTQMLRIKAQKPSSIANNVAQSYKNVKTTYKDARFALARVRR
tara:strand:+ start:38417 stop:39247 length:831 start_codon:yes stop_codon:yes gene_type:complete